MKGFTKSKIITLIVSVIAIIAVVVTMVFVLKGCRKDQPEEDRVTSQSDVGTEAPEETDPAEDTTAQADPEDTTVPEDTTTGDTTGSGAEPEDTETPDDPKEPEVQMTYYTVTFKNYDGTVLKTEKVEKGKGATAPASPKREHFAFAGWDKSFGKVTSDLVVCAKYTTNKTVIYADHVTVDSGNGKVTVNVGIINNPGIMGATLKVKVNDKVFSFVDAKKGDYPAFTLTSSGPQTTSSPYTFVLDALELSSKDKKDGTLFSITFYVKDVTAWDKFDVELSYSNGDIFDENYNYPIVVLENGTIDIK